jgi:peptidoglycan/LPS O-acetylase OafA/YrhL
MPITTPPRAALGGAMLAVAAGRLAPNNLLACYLTALAAAVLLFAAFMAYLDAAEHLDRHTGTAVATMGIAAALVMADAALRFPSILDPRPPSGAGALSVLALVSVAAGQLVDLTGLPEMRSMRQRLRPVRELLSR